MLNKKIILAITALAMVSMACGVTINLPVDQITTGPTQTEEINIPAPEAETVDLSLTFGAGELDLQPGAEPALVSGTATYNVTDFKPKIKVDGQQVRLETGNLDIHGIPNFKSNEIKNKWDLKLGDQPMQLKINAGAYQGDLELGGLTLKSLEVNDGAAETRLKFSEPNKTEMETLRYITGASSVKLSGLANANFTSMDLPQRGGRLYAGFFGRAAARCSRDRRVWVQPAGHHRTGRYFGESDLQRRADECGYVRRVAEIGRAPMCWAAVDR